MLHALAVVLHGDAEKRLAPPHIAFIARVLRALDRALRTLTSLGRSLGERLRGLRLLRGLLRLRGEPLGAFPLRLEIRVQRVVLPHVRLESDLVLVLAQRHLLDRDVHVGEHADGLRGVQRVLDELAERRVQRLPRVLEPRDALVVQEKLRRGLGLQVLVPRARLLGRHRAKQSLSRSRTQRDPSGTVAFCRASRDQEPRPSPRTSHCARAIARSDGVFSTQPNLNFARRVADSIIRNR